MVDSLDTKVEPQTESICPQGHRIPWYPELYAKDFSDGAIDADGIPMYEDGLYCLTCRQAYGLSKLKDASENFLEKTPVSR